MKKLLLLTAALAFASCIDFTAAKEGCYDAGICERDQADPPTLISHEPQSDAMNVNASAPLVLTFSRAMVPSTVQVQLTPPDMLSPPEWDDENLSAVLSPAVPLRYSTTYTVRVTGQSADTRTNLKDNSFTFTTRAAPDMTAPTLTSANPANGTTGISVTKLILGFSESMDPSSLRIYSNPEFNWGQPVWTAMNQTATLTPPQALAPLTTYVVTVEAEDASGNSLSGTRTIVFTTKESADTTKPIVVSVSPPSGSTDVSPNTNISVSFSEPMKPSVTSAFSIAPTVANVSCALDPAAVLLTCSHAVLAGDAGYTITINAANAVDLNDNALAQNFTSSFVTAVAPDTTKPTIMSVTPATGTQGVAYKPQLVITFSEPMDKLATQAAIGITVPAGTTGTFTWDMTGKVVTFKPTAPTADGFTPGTQFTWQVGSGARDLAGNTLLATQEYSFRVRRRSTVNISGQTADGYLYESGLSKVANTSTTSLYVGDTANNSSYRAFLFFDLASIPMNAIGIYEATLTVYQSSVTGAPYSIGSLIAEGIPYSTPLAASAWSVAPTSVPCTALVPQYPGIACAFHPDPSTYFLVSSSASAPSARTVNCEGWVTTALPDRKLALRLKMGTGSGEDNDSAIDVVYLTSADSSDTANRPKLQVTYEYP